LGISYEKSEFFEVFNSFFELCGVENRLGWHARIEKSFLDPGGDIRKIHVSIVVELLETMLEVQHNPWGLGDSIGFCSMLEILVIRSSNGC